MLNQKINTLLSDLVVEYHKLQNFHWYVKGPDFFQVHAKLEEYYNAINEAIDEVAEKLLMVGGSPLGSLKEFLENANIKEASSNYVSSKDLYGIVLADFEYLLNSVKEIKVLADEQNVFLVSAYMDELIEHFSKSVWMLKQVI